MIAVTVAALLSLTTPQPAQTIGYERYCTNKIRRCYRPPCPTDCERAGIARPSTPIRCKPGQWSPKRNCIPRMVGDRR